MKKMSNLAVLLLLVFTAFQQLSAQDVSENISKSKEKSTINSSDKTPKLVTYEHMDYYVIDGIWYGKFKNKYVLRQAPEGAVLDFLPKDGKEITITGKKYYECKRVFYKNIGNGLYKVVRP